MKWNGTEISVWNIEDARMEWNGKFREWNGRQSSILSYQFHTRLWVLYLQKNTYRCRMVINNFVTEVFNFNIYAYYLSTNRGTSVVYIAQTVYRYVLHHCKYIAIQRWKPIGSTGTGRVDRPVGLPVGSRFFDRPVKPVEKPVKFSFLATKRHLSTNRNIFIYFIVNKTFYKKTVLTNHIFRKHLLNGFKLWLICCDH